MPLLVLAACSGEGTLDGGAAAPGMFAPVSMQPGSPSGSPPTPELPPADPAPGVSNYDRPRGMPIGQDAPAGGEPGEADTSTPAGDPIDELSIPDFETPEEGPMVPCSGCIEIQAIVDNPNQNSDFSLPAGGINITGVVWHIIVPFNSDQLFIRSVVDGSDGTYTFMSANNFTVNEPSELPHAVARTANNVGLRIGSAGAWTGNQPVSVFIDSVTFESANATVERTFDTGPDGMTAVGTERNPRVIFHP